LHEIERGPTIEGMRGSIATCVVIGLLGVAAAIACGSEDESKFGDGSSGQPGSSSGASGGFPTNTPDGSGPAPVGPATDVQAVVTTDNAFSFGYGDATTLDTFIRGEGSDGPGIFNCPVGYGPVAYVVPAAKAPSNAYLYIIAWADNEVTQGTLAQFKRVGGKAIYSGDGAWQGCAIGKPYEDLGPGPDQATVTASIGECNKGASGNTFSKGWVTTSGALTAGAKGKLAFGEANDSPGGDFPIVCQKDDAGVSGIDAVARWMWFDPQDGQSPFVGNVNNRTKTFLLFRLPASALPPPPVK
jgi:hypothetical protein